MLLLSVVVSVLAVFILHVVYEYLDGSLVSGASFVINISSSFPGQMG